VPGEQPKVLGLVKLNTNENPYPPSPKVLAAVRAATDGRLRLYPNPTADGLRKKLARLHRCAVENIIVGNGSDELLALATRAFVDPVAGVKGSQRYRATVQYFTPSYSLYPVLADIHGALKSPVPLREDFSLPFLTHLRRDLQWDFRAALSFLTTPNAPTGTAYPVTQLEALCQEQEGVIVLDEAYVDFASDNALRLTRTLPNVIVARTFSKAYALCFQRVGYFVGHPELIGALHKVRDSYNVNGLGQVAAEATLDDLPYYQANFQRLIATRERLSRALTDLGFAVCPSQTNFLFARPPQWPAEQWLEALRRRKVLVRWWNHPEVKDYLRISVGTDDEADVLLEAVHAVLAKGGK
jgi:histidinol-phosphate aminotransferase